MTDTTVALTIHVTAPNPGDATRWAQGIADHVTGQFGDTMRLHAAITDPDQHHYLSTGRLHGEHAYCQGKTGQAGAKKPGVCKFCEAPCQCDCHTLTP